MAEADLDVLIRSIAKKSNKTLLDAAKKRRGKYLALAAKAKKQADPGPLPAGCEKHRHLCQRRRPADPDFRR